MALVNAETLLKTLLGVMNLCRSPPYLTATAQHMMNLQEPLWEHATVVAYIQYPGITIISISCYHIATTEGLNNATCGRFNRDGQLCGKCKEGYHPPVYSYDVQCMKCSGKYAWMKYIAVAFGPLTVFFLFVMCFRISATSPKMYAFVTFSHIVTVRPFISSVKFRLLVNPKFSMPVQSLVTLYGIWSLDIFRMVLPDICLKVNTLQSLALDYTVPFYPLVLLIITYLLIKLHDNFQFAVRLWRPFQICFACFQRQWDVKTSVTDAFATFLFLSSMRLLNVSFDLLVPTHVYHQNGSVVGLYLFYDATIDYFGREHLPYAILGLFVLLVFVFLPLLLLLLYPMRCFQQCLGRCGVRWHALHIFMDASRAVTKTELMELKIVISSQPFI